MQGLDSIYTLVLDLDETLIHFEIDEDIDPEVEDPGYYLIRPGALNFLSHLSEYFEIVLFTAAMPDVSIDFIQFYNVFYYSMPIGLWIILIRIERLFTGYIDSIQHLMKTMQ
jgi:hypothetical protein